MKFTISRNTKKNGIEIDFVGLPERKYRAWMKSRGFRYNKTLDIWWKKETPGLWDDVNAYFNKVKSAEQPDNQIKPTNMDVITIDKYTLTIPEAYFVWGTKVYKTTFRNQYHERYFKDEISLSQIKKDLEKKGLLSKGARRNKETLRIAGMIQEAYKPNDYNKEKVLKPFGGEEKEEPEHPIPEYTMKDFTESIIAIRPFVNPQQIESLGNLYRTEEREGAVEIVERLRKVIEEMPETYQTEGTKTPDKIVYLHYFSSSSDWYIAEKDKGYPDDAPEDKGKQLQAYGYTILNGDLINAEWGFISIEELRGLNVELDFYWTPEKFSKILAEKELGEPKEPEIPAGPEFKVGDVVANTRTITIGIVRLPEDRGELKTDADSNVNVSELEMYDPIKHRDYQIAPSTAAELGWSSPDDIDENLDRERGDEYMSIWKEFNHEIMQGIDGLDLLVDQSGTNTLIGRAPDINNIGIINLNYEDPDVHSYSPAYKDRLDEVVFKIKEIYRKRTEGPHEIDALKDAELSENLMAATYENSFTLNKAIERLLDNKWNDHLDNWTPDEIEFISQYSGYGGLDKFGEISRGSLFEYYTPDLVIEKMWGLARKYGYKDGSVLEPSIGVGSFFNRKFVSENVYKVAYETNKYSAKIVSVLYPEVIINDDEKDSMYFEEAFIKNNWTVKNKVGNPFSLVIGNPPYGAAEGKWINMGEKQYTKARNYIDYFIFRGLDLLAPGGLLIYIIGAEVAGGGSPWLDQGTSKTKEAIAAKADLIDAFRLPNGVFDRTDVVSDIIVMRKS